MFTTNSSFTVLYTTDVQRTHDFYKQIGAVIKQLETDKVVVSIGDFDLHIILYTTEPFESYKYLAQPGQYGHGTIYYIESDNLEKDFEVIKNAGGVIKSPITPNHWDCQEFLFEDPNGYKFAVYQ